MEEGKSAKKKYRKEVNATGKVRYEVWLEYIIQTDM